MSGLTSARSNRGGSRGTRMTGQTYDFSAQDGNMQNRISETLNLRAKSEFNRKVLRFQIGI